MSAIRLKPTAKNLAKYPALFWDETNECIRITYPDGKTEVPDYYSNKFIFSLFSTKEFCVLNGWMSRQTKFIGWLS